MPKVGTWWCYIQLLFDICVQMSHESWADSAANCELISPEWIPAATNHFLLDSVIFILPFLQNNPIPCSFKIIFMVFDCRHSCRVIPICEAITDLLECSSAELAQLPCAWAKPPHTVRLLLNYIILVVDASQTLAQHEVCWDHKLGLIFFSCHPTSFQNIWHHFAPEFVTLSLIMDNNHDE